MSADLIVTNANIYTVNPAQPTASAFAVRDGKFIAVGDAAAIDALRGPQTQVLDEVLPLEPPPEPPELPEPLPVPGACVCTSCDTEAC